MKCLAIIATILQAVVLVFVIVATPIDVFRSKYSYNGYRTCYSMWGFKRCGNYKANAYKGFPCKHVRNTMNAAAAFAIVSIFLTLIVLLLRLFLICKCIGGCMIPAIVGIIAFCTILVSWSCMAGAYYYGECTFIYVDEEVLKLPKLSELYNLNMGFGLMVTAWIVQQITVILLFFS